MYNTCSYNGISKITYQFSPCGHTIKIETFATLNNDGKYVYHYTSPQECPECKQIATPQYNSTIGSRIF